MSSPSRPTTWLVTGSSRGIGFEIVRQLLASPTNLVVAAVRTPEKATALHALKASAKGILHVVQVDVSDFDSIRALPKQLDPILCTVGLDYLVNNAGICIDDTAFTLDPETIMQIVRTNVAGPALITQIALPYLTKGNEKKVLHISSGAGSIGSVGGWGEILSIRGASYSLSKSALNMLATKQRFEHPELTIIPMCPGWVKTDMGGKDAPLDVEDSVAGVLKVITSATHADSGRYLRNTGEEFPW
ncbi:NAD-P-binding protein [Trametes meyenii]|nr:NAD-P-binding protein [Trametes meyenii]